MSPDNNIGKRVRLVGTRYLDGPSNPVWGGNCGRVVGTICGGIPENYDVKWDNGHANNCYRIGRDIEIYSDESITQRIMAVTGNVSRMMKKLLDADTQALVKAGYINGDLELTTEGKTAIWEILFDTHKEALVASAKESIAEEEKSKAAS